MNEKGLIEQVLRIINANYSNIYVIDVIDDKVYNFSFAVANNLVINKVMSYTNDFINLAYKFVHEEDIITFFKKIDGTIPNKHGDKVLSLLNIPEINRGHMCRNICIALPSKDACDALQDIFENDDNGFT